MFPVVDQNRQENQHQTVHVHMHQVCACMYPFYTNYRPPILAPYHLQPLPRPYNMQHYQYTQFNVSPFNVPLLHTGAAPIAQTTASLSTPTQPQTAVPTPLDFGPPPRDRRTFESPETTSQEAAAANTEPTKNTTGTYDEYGIPVGGLGDLLQGTHDYDAHNMPVTTENFTKFLEQGCIIAEKIAIRNQHRPCFKNIQNLCNRTRGEILKASNTVSNIHSQGIPWATKDFIYAYVRLINCWHMLKGYLESKDGTLGNIDRELTPDFKNCYITWEKSTKLLAGHMIRIFTNLDNNVSNPNANIVHKAKMAPNHEVPVQQQKQESVAVAAAVAAVTAVTQQKPKEPVLQKVKQQNSVCEMLENVLLSESTTSPHDEDSDNESRVYMKPGSYNVPKKGNGNPNIDSSNSSPSIEFFDTAQNVSAHYKKISKRKDGAVSTINNDQMWQDAQSAVPYLMNKINQPPLPTEVPRAPNACEELDESALKYYVDLNTLEHHAADIQEWLNSSNFFENQNGADNNSESPLASTSCPDRPVTVLQRVPVPKHTAGLGEPPPKSGGPFYKGNRLDVQSGTYRKRAECSGVSGQPPPPPPVEKGYGKTPGYRKSNASMWEHDSGGLTGTAIIVLEDIVKVLEKEGLPKWIGYGISKDCIDHPTLLSTIRKKLNTRKYNYVNEFVQDLKNLLSCAEIFYEAHPEVLQQLNYFEERLEVLLNREFSAFDFSCFGDKGGDLGPLILKPGRRSDGEGDH